MTKTIIDRYNLPPDLADRMMTLCGEMHKDIITRLHLSPKVARTLVAHVLATMARVISETQSDSEGDDEKIIH